jgi:hypothetical protein
MGRKRTAKQTLDDLEAWERGEEPETARHTIRDVTAVDMASLEDDVKAHIAYVLAGSGIRHETIQKVLDISESTLYRNYKEELDQGKDLANASVAFSLHQMAVYGEDARAKVTACIFWLKARAGWKETTVVEGKVMPASIDTSKLSQDDLATMERLIAKCVQAEDAAAAIAGTPTQVH